jgi:5'-nucleotidase
VRGFTNCRKAPLIDPLVDWTRIDTVLLDMDGTLLDLRFDNHFWCEYLPMAYAQARCMDLDTARGALLARMNALRGTLDWYCVDFWSRELKLDIVAMKHALRDGIRERDGAVEFLAQVRDSGRALYLLTNAHQESLEIKLEQTGIERFFDTVLSSHSFGTPKEQPGFWTQLVQRFPLDPARCLFIDDSEPVLAAARNFGIGQVLAVAKPDSTLPAAPRPGFLNLNTFAEVLPIPDRAG